MALFKAIQNQQVITVSMSDEAMLKIQMMDEERRAEEEAEREYIQARVDEKFSDWEQSVLWQCMNDKNEDKFHEQLNPIVRKHMSSTVPVELYRGISRLERSKIEDLDVGDEFQLNRVTSFSSDFSTAKQFAGRWHYDTNIIFSMRNCPWAYNYYEDIMQIVLGAPSSEFMGKVVAVDEQRLDKIDMIEGEQEFMLPSEARFRIVEIDTYRKDPNEPLYEVYHLELIEW